MKPAEYWLRCGECGHFVSVSDNKYWCHNAKCQQAETKLPIEQAAEHDQRPK